MSNSIGRRKHRRLTVRHLKNRKAILLLNQECKIFHYDDSEYGEYSSYYTKTNRNRALPLITPWPDEIGGSMVGTGWKESTKRRRQRKNSNPSAKLMNSIYSDTVFYDERWDNEEINWAEVDKVRKNTSITIKKEDGMMVAKYEKEAFIGELSFLKDYGFSDDDILRLTERDLVAWIEPYFRQDQTEELFKMLINTGIRIRDLVISFPMLLTWGCSDFQRIIMHAYPHFIDYEHFIKCINKTPTILAYLLDDDGDGNIGVDLAGHFRETALAEIEELKENSEEADKIILEAEERKKRNALSIARLEKQVKAIENKIIFQELSNTERPFNEIMDFILPEGNSDPKLAGWFVLMGDETE